MKKISDEPDKAAELRLRAEELARDDSPATSETLHELRVYQIELEMQNNELRRTQTELEVTKNRYFDLYSLAPVGYMTISEKGLILETNQTAATMLGVPKRSLLKKRFTEFVLNADQNIYYQHRKSLFDTGEAQSCEIRMLIHNDEQRMAWAHLDLTIAQETDGKPVCRVTLSDISALKQFEENLRESEAFKLGLLNSVPAEIAVLDHNGVILAVNESWQRFALEYNVQSGKPAPQIKVGINYLAVCKTDTRFTADDSASKAQQGIEAVLDGSLPKFNLEYPSHLSEQQRWYNMSVIPLSRDNDLLSNQGALITHSNITERYLAVQMLQQAHDELELRVAERTQALQEEINERKQVEKELRDSEEKWRSLIKAIPDFVSLHDREGRFLFLSHYADGFSEKDVIGTSVFQYLSPKSKESFKQSIDNCHATGTLQKFEHTAMGDHGSMREYEDYVIPINKENEPETTLLVSRDITERKQTEDQLRQLSRAVKYSPASIIITDPDGNIEYVNPKFIKLTGYNLEEVRGQTPRIMKSGQTPPEVYEELWQTILAGNEWRGEFLNRKKNGELFWESASISSITDPKGTITHFIGIREDISDRKASEEKIRLLNAELEKLAMTDYLTNLNNRRFFIQRGVEEIKRAHRNSQPLALLMVDIDEFKNVNDTYGHEIGDLALQHVAEVMKSSLREIDLLGRLGGEEFAALLPNTTLEDALLSAERVRETIANMSLEIAGQVLSNPITISVGVATITDGMSGIDDLLRKADIALYRAKNNGRNCVSVYQENQTLPPQNTA